MSEHSGYDRSLGTARDMESHKDSTKKSAPDHILLDLNRGRVSLLTRLKNIESVYPHTLASQTSRLGASGKH